MSILDHLSQKLKGAGGGPPVVTREQVLDALRQVEDPDLHQDIVTLNFVKDVTIEAGNVRAVVELTTPACPVKELLKTQCEDKIRAIPFVTSATVEMTAQTRAAPKITAPNIAESLGQVKNIIAVASGKGGVAKSTTAVNLAFALARGGAKVGIMDADVYGPSVPLMTGVGQPSDTHGNMVVPPQINGVKIISIAMFSSAKSATIMRGPMASQVIKQFLSQVAWGELDYLIVDYPPGTGDIQLSISQIAPITCAVVVTTPQEVALIDVRKAISMFATMKVPVLGIIETMSYYLCEGEDKKHYLFGRGGGTRVAAEFGLPLLGEIPIDPRVCTSADRGHPIVTDEAPGPAGTAYLDAAGATARQLSILNSKDKNQLESFSLIWQ